MRRLPEGPAGPQGDPLRRALRRQAPGTTPAVNAGHYARNRLLVETALNAYEAGGAAWITTEAARRLADAGNALADAVAALDRTVMGAPTEWDPTGMRVIRLARTHLRNEAEQTARLVAQVMRALSQ